jgi:hypothetical protein
LTVPALALAACSTGNDRTYIGNDFLPGGAVHLDAFSDTPRPEAPPAPAQPSLVSIERSNWTPQVIVSPMDGVAATRTYAINYTWAHGTARQMGRFPTTVSSLEISDNSFTGQITEAIASFPIAFAGGVMILPRMITHSPTREVRYFPQQYWRAPAETRRKATVGPVDVNAAPAPAAPADAAPAQPAPPAQPPAADAPK